MDAEETILLRLVRLVVAGRREHWPALIDAVGNLVRRGFLAAARNPADLEEFESWFPGWLYSGRKIHAAHRAVDRKMQSGECADKRAQNDFLANYLASTVKSAVADFYRERGQNAFSMRETGGLGSRSPSPSRGDLHEDRLHQLRDALEQLPQNLRVPFRLKYYAAVGPLTEEDLRFVAVQGGLATDEIAKHVENEFRRNAGRAFPIGSAFIGGLLRIAAADDGRNTTVDQRIGRAKMRLRELLAVNG